MTKLDSCPLLKETFAVVAVVQQGMTGCEWSASSITLLWVVAATAAMVAALMLC